MNTTTYKFENCDGEQFPEIYTSLASALRDCSDFRTFKYRADGGYYTREGGFVFPIID